MTTVKKHTRKGKNKATVVRQHSRKGGRSMKEGAGTEYASCNEKECTLGELKEAKSGKWGSVAAKKAKKELKRRGECK